MGVILGCLFGNVFCCDIGEVVDVDNILVVFGVMDVKGFNGVVFDFD